MLRKIKLARCEGKGKCGRKRKSPTPESRTKMVRMSEVPEPRRASAAQMAVEDWIVA